MGQRKPSEIAKKLVWRISESSPLGEFVDPSALPAGTADRTDRPEVFSGGWVMSSFELLHGTDVNEDPDTVPDDLFDELFPAPRPAPTPAEKK